jgi:MFS family permease
MTFGAIYTLGTVTPYIASYIYYHSDQTIRITDVTLIYPFSMLFQSIGQAVSMNCLQKIFKYRPLAIIGMVGFVASYLMASFVSSLVLYILFYAVIAGFFQGVTYMIPFINSYEYLP